MSVDKPLSGYRIAIDPGHVADDYQMAQIEMRYIDIRKVDSKESYRFYEAELNLSTALVLKDSLEAKGAEVFLTRNTKKSYCAHKSFHRWYEEDLKKELKRKGMNAVEIREFLENTSLSKIFRTYYSRKDLDARADKINYFKPDFTIVIHYNADSEKKRWNSITPHNYCLTFVPGAYLKNEMNTRLERFDFLRVLVTDYFLESTKLSSEIIDEFEKQLKVDVLETLHSPEYIRNFSLKVKKGVYARNLRLCRLLESPICYGEALLQDNIQELENFQQNDLEEGKICRRVVKVAEAYFRGIIRYTNLKRKEKRF